MFQVAAPHNRLLPTVETMLVFITGSVSNVGVSAVYAYGNTRMSILTDEFPVILPIYFTY
jgi:hypothetical protein